MEELLRIKSKATSLDGVRKALEKQTDFLEGMTNDEKYDYIISATREGSLEADGKNITIYVL